MGDEEKKQDEMQEDVNDQSAEELSDEDLDDVAGGAKKIKPDSY